MQYKGFECLVEFEFKGIPVHYYKSTKTGLQVALSYIEGPIVNGNFTLATETDNHDGCPHVLEHLIFLGSEDYKYKGILDKLANRCFAQGTNAWTDVDHTCYTLECAGKEGFLNILPVYIDHILYPTLTESGFYTEVHHIDGEGEDAGVVYSEMQGSENTGSSLTHHGLMETLWEGSGYASNTGGRMENLRTLNVDTVRKYHSAYYRPDNLCVIVSGPVHIKDIIDALQPVEEKILKKNLIYPTTRPWTSKIPPFEKTVEKKIQFPSDEDDAGAIAYVAWRNHSLKWNNFLEKEALSVLWTYLTTGAVSPLQKEMVDLEDPFCGEISYDVSNTCLLSHSVNFRNIATNKLDLIKDKFFSVINDVVKNGIDMKRMKSVIKRKKVEFLNEFEEEAHHTASYIFINFFLYHQDVSDLKNSLGDIELLNFLDDQEESFWLDLIKQNITMEPYVCLLGEPSQEFGEKLADQEDDRLDKQAEMLGDDAMDELEEILEKHQKNNNLDIPKEILEKFKVPNVSNIQMIPITTFVTNQEATTSDAKKLATHIGKDFPYMIQFDQIPSEFIEITAYMDTTGMESAHRHFIELYLEALFELPIKRQDGTYLSHEQVVFMIQDETVSYSNGCGSSGGNFSCGAFAQLLNVSLKFEKTQFASAVAWLKDVLYNTQFVAERLKISAKKLVDDVANFKRSARSITNSAMKYLNFDKNESNHVVCGFMKQVDFLHQVMNNLNKDPKPIVQQLEEFRAFITDPNRMRIHIVGDIYYQQDIHKIFTSNFVANEKSQNMSKYKYTRDLLSGSKKQAYIFGLSSTDSTSLSQTVPGISDFNDERIAPLKVLIEFLTGLESPFWKKIRGAGLSYSYSIHISVEEGLMYFGLSKSSSPVKAYIESNEILKEFLNGKIEFDQTSLDAAKSACIFEIISYEETMHAASTVAFYNTLKKVPHDYNKVLIEKIAAVKVEDLKVCLKDFLKKLFTNDANLVIVTNSGKVEEIQDEFKDQIKRSVKVAEIETFFK